MLELRVEHRASVRIHGQKPVLEHRTGVRTHGSCWDFGSVDVHGHSERTDPWKLIFHKTENKPQTELLFCFLFVFLRWKSEFCQKFQCQNDRLPFSLFSSAEIYNVFLDTDVFTPCLIRCLLPERSELLTHSMVFVLAASRRRSCLLSVLKLPFADLFFFSSHKLQIQFFFFHLHFLVTVMSWLFSALWSRWHQK